MNKRTQQSDNPIAGPGRKVVYIMLDENTWATNVLRVGDGTLREEKIATIIGSSKFNNKDGTDFQVKYDGRLYNIRCINGRIVHAELDGGPLLEFKKSDVRLKDLIDTLLSPKVPTTQGS